MPRMIVCPDCGGTGGVAYQYPGEQTARVYCGTCVSTPGTIPDRRRATPNDRAVYVVLEEDRGCGVSLVGVYASHDVAYGKSLESSHYFIEKGVLDIREEAGDE